MGNSFFLLRFHRKSTTGAPKILSSAAARGIDRSAADPSVPEFEFSNDETAARFYLARFLKQDARPTSRGLREDPRPEVLPDLIVESIQQQRLTDTRVVQFQQTRMRIPVFGTNIVVELDQRRDIVSISGVLASTPDVSPLPTLLPADALKKIADASEVAVDTLQSTPPPTLTYFQAEGSSQWHLAYFFRDVNAAPPPPPGPPPSAGAAKEPTYRSAGHGRKGRASRRHLAIFNYLVDAHDGEILFSYSATPLIVKGKGHDDDDTPREVYVTKAGSIFLLNDPFRRIKTFDLKQKDVGSPVGERPLDSAHSDWGKSNPPAISAQYNAAVVYDFFNSILFRDGVDGKGMDLICVVNAVDSSQQKPPVWSNACWWQRRMWYGQDEDGHGRLRSWARHLDIVAHELMHGVTEFTCGLIYKNQSGALNESFSDIFAIIIKNWAADPKGDPVKWKWEIGPGLGDDGGPLRDMSDPKRTKDPEHMDDYWETTEDEGGVHTNSNIHNKAAYNLLTARSGDAPAIAPRDVAILYYLCLSHLHNRARFIDVRNQLLDVASTYFEGSADLAEKLAVIESSYESVGIQ